MQRIIIIVTLFFTMIISGPSSGKGEPQDSAFANQTEMRRVIRQNLSDLRRSYKIILTSRDKNLAAQAALYYRDAYLKSPDDPKIQAEYAFAHMVATAIFPYDTYSPQKQRLLKELVGYFLEAEECRAKSAESLKGVVEVTVMNATWKNQEGDYITAVKLARAAVQQDNEWAYTHYWLGRTLTSLMFAQKEKTLKKRQAKEAIKELNRAEALDPRLSNGNILFDYVHNYTALEDYQTALRYMDKRIVVIARDTSPSAALQRENLTGWRAALLAKSRGEPADL